MAAEILDIVVRQKGARKVARDIATIGIAAKSSQTSLRALQTTLDTTKNKLAAMKGQTTAAGAAMKGFGASAAGAKRSLTALGTGVALVGGAIAAALTRPLRGAISATADFQQAMNLTGVLVQVDRTSTEFKKLEESAKELGLTTQFTATQAAEGMQFLGKAGLDWNEVLDSIGPTTNVAAAAQLDMGKAADLTTNILRGFRQEVKDLPRAIDILAATFTSSNTDIQELAKAFRDAGPIAVSFGQKFEDVAAVLASLADAGIKSQKSGIALRRIMINLQDDADKTNSVLRRLGISIFEVGEDGVKRFRPLSDIFIDIANSSATGTEKIDLFGARALAASQIIELSAEGMDAYAKSISEATGRALEVGSARLKGFWGQVRLLKSAFESLGIAIVESGLLPFLEKLVQKTTRAVRAIANLPKPILSVIGFALALAAALATVTLQVGLLVIAVGVLKGSGALLGVTSVLGSVTAALKTFTLFLLTNPIGIFIVAIGAAIAILYAMRNELITFGDKTFTLGDLMIATWEAIVDVLKSAKDWFVDLFDSASESWDNFFGDTNASLVGFGADLKSVLNLVKAFLNAIISIPILLGRVVLAALNVMAKPAAAFISGIVDLIRDIPSMVKGAFTGKDILESITKPFVDAFNEVKIEGEDLVNDLGGIITTDYLGEAGDVLLTILDGFEITDRAHQRYIDRLKKRQADAAADAAAASKTLGGEGTVTDPGLGVEEIKSRAQALADLLESMIDLTAAEKKLQDAGMLLRKSFEADITTAESANLIYQFLANQTFQELERSLFPVNEELKKQNDQLRELKKVADAAGISDERLAKAQDRVRESAEKAVLALEDFQESLSATDALQMGMIEGVNQFGESLGNAFTNIRDLTESTLNSSMDAIHEFVSTGKLDFREFALSVIGDIQKVILKLMVLQTLGAFEAKEEFGGGIGGFLKAFTEEDFTGFERFKTGAEEKAQEGIAGPELGSSVTNPLYANVSNTAETPVYATLSDPEMPALVSVREAIVEATRKGAQSQIDQLMIINTTLQNISASVSQGGLGGQTPGIESNTEAVFQTGEATLGGLTDVMSRADLNSREVSDTTAAGFNANIGAIGQGSMNIVNALIAGDKKSAITGVLGLAMTVVGGMAGGGGGGAAQHGANIGPSQVGQSFLVGETGPEMFAPPRTGRIIPNDQLAGMSAPPEVNVQVVNVDDPTSIPEAMGTREGEKAILNVITRNRGKLRETLA